MKMEAALAQGDQKVLKDLIKDISPEDHVRLYLDLYVKQLTPCGFRKMDINGDSKGQFNSLPPAYKLASTGLSASA